MALTCARLVAIARISAGTETEPVQGVGPVEHAGRELCRICGENPVRGAVLVGVAIIENELTHS